MKVNAIIEATVGKVDEIADRNGHLRSIELGLEGAHAGREGCGLGHGVRRWHL